MRRLEQTIAESLELVLEAREEVQKLGGDLAGWDNLVTWIYEQLRAAQKEHDDAN